MKISNIILAENKYLPLPGVKTKTALNRNILVIGGAGTGKTRNFIKPNLLQMHSSYVVTDFKGETLRDVGTVYGKLKM